MAIPPELDFQEERQLRRLKSFSRRYRAEYARLPRRFDGRPFQYFIDNGYFESVDGEMLYCFLRHFRPKRMIEVGAGFSTLLAAQVLRENGDGAELTAIDPAPKPWLLFGFDGLTRLMAERAQDVPLAEFRQLREGDVLFIDSSHRFSPGSDVDFLFLDVLPRLRQGVVIHVHDIFLPGNYPIKLIERWNPRPNEQYLVHAILAGNSGLEVLWSGSFMHLMHPRELAKAFPSYDPKRRWPGSLWLQVRFSSEKRP
jgi:predicted O-methyltransferase YrrM